MADNNNVSNEESAGTFHLVVRYAVNKQQEVGVFIQSRIDGLPEAEVLAIVEDWHQRVKAEFLKRRFANFRIGPPDDDGR